MSGLLFVLKRNLPDMALAEAKACAYGWRWWLRTEREDTGTVLFPRARKHAEPALTRFVVNARSSCPARELPETLAGMRWRLPGTYRVTLTRLAPHPFSERTLAALVSSSGKPDLANPRTIIDLVLTKTRVHIGTRAWTNGSFESRKAHRMPAMHPSALHPAVARALVNLSGAERIHDPFCGAGGILIEAGLAGKRVSGADIDVGMLGRAKKNCRQHGLCPELRTADATDWLPRVQALVTDLPYGKNTRDVDIAALLDAFLMRARAATRRIVIGLPSQRKTFPGWKERAHFSQYVHKSMTRHFYVLERDSSMR